MALPTFTAFTFETKLATADKWVILHLPKSASQRLPSRGQIMVKGTINDEEFQIPLEPDGDGSHWLKLADALGKTKLQAGDSVKVSLEPADAWSEPRVPEDLQRAIRTSDTAQIIWKQITPLARWEWVRWVRSTANNETRQHRIGVAISKLEHGKRRPCCWNRNLCTDPTVSKNGVLQIRQHRTV